MLKRIVPKILLILQLSLFAAPTAQSQCAIGFNAASTNWDWLDYLTSTGNYVPTANYPGVPAALAANQAFAIGRNRFTIAYAGGVACTLGENGTNTAEFGSFGAGADVQYANNGTITITFDTVVYNVRFSIYDIDINQTATLTATDPLVTPLIVTMAVVTAGNIIIVGSPGVAPVATANATADANNDTKGTLNVTVAGGITGVKRVIITIGGTAGDFWLSDISACVYGSFATNYFVDAQPFTGQSAYILSTPDSNSVSYIDTATAKAKFLFSGNLAADANAPKFVNGLAYDHKKHFLYYVHDFGTNAYNTRTLRMWDYNTETISALAVDVNTLGIPTFNFGVESAGASFYDGALYFGVEGNNSSRNSNRETIVWRIDFDAANNPVKSCQVWATPSDNGLGTTLHDWNDFTVKDGMLYNFDGAGSTAQDNYYHFNLQTGVMVANITTAVLMNIPRQTAITWSGAIYWVYDSIGVYNGAGSVGVKKKITGTTPTNFAPDWAIGTIIGSTKGASGDAAGPFKPKTDFGDAPATYDPVTSDPATHDRDSTLRIGVTFDREWINAPSVLADGDGADEDGLAFVPIFSPGAGTYLAQVSVYNNTGANATLIAWLDYDGNAVFDAGEACNTLTVPSSTSIQLQDLYWPSITSSLPTGTYTYLRIRMTSAANGMTGSNPTGYYSNGEVEDYRVVVDNFPLTVNLLSFDAKVSDSKTVKLNWTTSAEVELRGYDVERSNDGSNWNSIGFVNAKGNYLTGTIGYYFEDINALKGKSYYRLKMVNGDNKYRYSEVKTILIKEIIEDVIIMPNPAKNISNVSITSNVLTDATIYVLDLQGQKVRIQKFRLNAGTNTLVLDNLGTLPGGTYIIKIIAGDMVIDKKLIIKK